jgi:antitoxin ChpS
MYKTKLRNVGGSVMFAIPKPILESLGLAANRDVGLSVSNGRLVVDPQPRKRYTLNELVGQCNPDAPLTDEDRLWLDDAPQGREAL